MDFDQAYDTLSALATGKDMKHPDFNSAGSDYGFVTSPWGTAATEKDRLPRFHKQLSDDSSKPAITFKRVHHNQNPAHIGYC